MKTILFTVVLAWLSAQATAQEPGAVPSPAPAAEAPAALPAQPAAPAAEPAAPPEPPLPTFGDVINILGAMERTDQDLQDGLALDLFSPKNRTLVVQQNTKPLSGRFVTGTTGETFVAVMNYSYIIKMNETAQDLIAKIEIPYDPVALAVMGVQEGNTFVGTLAADGQSWVVDETTRNVHRTENNTRIIKMTSLDGEYMLLGRQAADLTNIFVQYGLGATRTVNVTAGGRQEAEFVDGLRLSMVTEANVGVNVDLTNGVAAQSLPAGTASLYSFAWTVNSSNPTVPMNTTMQFPVNQQLLAGVSGGNKAATIRMATRALGSTGPFAEVPGASTAMVNGRVAVSNLKAVDGQYVLLVSTSQAAAGKKGGQSKEEAEEAEEAKNKGE